jgi:GT2 family glycosyltransferase
MSVITASVVLYNTPESQLVALLDCIRHSSIPVQLYAVDNSPNPQCPPYLKGPGITYLRAPSNKGYGAGHNIALRQVLDTAEFHFVLNPDICFERTELEKMLDFIQTDPAIGQLMPRIIYPDGSLQYLCKLLPTPADLILRRFQFGPLKWLQTTRAERFELRHSGYNKVLNIPYLSGCFMLFRTSALRTVGLFDERFFMYMEDIDMTRRMHAEFRTIFYPNATVIHDHAKESYKNFRALRVHIRNSIKYFNKWGWIRDAQRTRFNREILECLRESARRTPIGIDTI